MKTTTKQVTVLAVYKFNKVARICFETLSSNGNDHYHTCFQGNGRESCSCPSKGGCYHRDQLRERAQAYFESQKQGNLSPATTAKPVATYRDEQGQVHQVTALNGNLVDATNEAEQVAAVAEVKAEAKLAAFQQAMTEQYESDPRHGLSQGEVESAQSFMRHYDDRY